MNGAVGAIASSALPQPMRLSSGMTARFKGATYAAAAVNSTALSSRLRLLRCQLEFVCHSAELRQGVDAHLPHQMTAMDLHCNF